MRRWLVFVLLGACTPSSPPTDRPAPTPTGGAETALDRACASDADCVISTFDGCCLCPQCPGPEHALSVSGATTERAAAHCETVDCSREDAWCAVAGMCPRGPPVVAACIGGRCELRAAVAGGVSPSP